MKTPTVIQVHSHVSSVSAQGTVQTTFSRLWQNISDLIFDRLKSAARKSILGRNSVFRNFWKNGNWISASNFPDFLGSWKLRFAF